MRAGPRTSGFQELAPRGEEFVSSFYDRLLSKYPEVKPLFADTDMAEQKKKVLNSLVLVVNNLRKPDVLGPALKQLGERHREIGVKKEHHPMVGEALLATFASYFGEKWTPELKSARAEAYGAVVSGMTD